VGKPFALPVVTAADPRAAADWQAAVQVVEREAETKAVRLAAVANRVPQLTMTRASDYSEALVKYPQGDSTHPPQETAPAMGCVNRRIPLVQKAVQS
jgi:hypothetical protein